MASIAEAFGREWTIGECSLYTRLTSRRPSSVCTATVPALTVPRSGELRTPKLKSHLMITQSLNVVPLMPGVGQYIAIHATLTSRNFFIAYFYPSSPFICIFSKTSPDFFLRWLWLTPVPVQARRIKKVTLLDAGSHVECPRNINRLKS